MKAWLSIWILITSGMLMYQLSDMMNVWYMKVIVYLITYTVIATIFVWYKERLFK